MAANGRIYSRKNELSDGERTDIISILRNEYAVYICHISIAQTLEF